MRTQRLLPESCASGGRPGHLDDVGDMARAQQKWKPAPHGYDNAILAFLELLFAVKDRALLVA